MVMLKPPFAGANLATMIIRIVSADPDPLPSSAPPEYVETFCQIAAHIGAVAQMVERLLSMQEVAGSMPAGSMKYFLGRHSSLHDL